ncbi:hypothetical protein PV327_008940 [Microctonus hyperodae]|uniref:Uncharacterized protein n=1 Tax=Microctonus hyperodae TaxID=165561 RepID=A0AA39KVI9_MICHY|nr:hypothetical protein PV327_008940 [Microctonus hyperodae]
MENKNYNTKTLKTFVDSILWSNDNLEHSLFNLYELIWSTMNVNMVKGLVTLVGYQVQAKNESLCNQENSPQQQMYNVLMLLIRTNLKSFTTLTQAYSMQSIFDNMYYINEYKYSKQRLHEQLKSYIETFTHKLNTFPTDIYKCDIKNPVIGKNVYEMEGLFQVLVNYKRYIKGSIDTRNCRNCKELSNRDYGKFIINNCESYTSLIGCPTSKLYNWRNTIRLSWFKADSESKRSETFGHSGRCNHTLFEMNNYLKWFVSGVKFILHNNAIHLQIQQNKISRERTVVEKPVWKPVDIDNNNKKININYTNVFYKRHSFYLDDVMVHPGFIITGVKLQLSKNHDGFELHVHATKYNYETGLLSEPKKWFTPGEYNPNHKDYQRRRTEIKMNDPDNPTKAHDYYPDLQPNKFIQFRHTSIKKDIGSHTVPFFDGQSVESSGFPLGGIGLFYRQRDGFGGYIAPRLLTYNITWHLESSLNNWQKIDEAHLKCGLDVPPNITEFNEDASCETRNEIANSQIEIKNLDGSKHDINFTYPQSSYYYHYSPSGELNDSTENHDVIIMLKND